MALNKGLVLAFTISLMALCGSCSGTIYRVGDSAGWTTIGGVDYNNWASSKTFHVGDTIIFEYESRFHNVMQVTHNDFQTCDVTSPMATYTSGSDSITLKGPSNLYFTCGVPGHCEAGQKIEIRVLPASLSPIGSPTSSPSPSSFTFVNSGSPSIIMHPRPAQNSATTSNLYYSSLGSLFSVAVGLWMVGLSY